MANYNVIEDENGRFTTWKEGAKQPTSRDDGKNDSWSQAIGYAYNSGGGHVAQYDKDGNLIREKEVDS